MPFPSKITEEVLQTVRQHLAENPKFDQKALAVQLGINRGTLAKAVMQAQAETAAPATTAQGAGMTQAIAFDDIVISGFNPRKTFEEQELADLAESIAVNGLLQNLVLRPHNGDKFLLIAGERRYRAIGRLREDGRWPEDRPIDCRVIDADDGDHLALALLENLQRQDVPPLEEADAFAQLQDMDPERWSAKAIAEKIGRTPRYVFSRLSFARKLSPVARHALETKMITIEGARILTAAPQEAQAEILSQYEEGETIDTGDLKWELKGTLINVSHALFDVEVSGLEIVEVDGENFFADRKAAVEAQMKAVRAKAKELKKDWAFVEVLEPGTYLYASGFCQTNTSKEKGGGAVIEIDTEDYEVTIHIGCTKRPQTTPQQPRTPILSTEEYKAKQLAEHQARMAEEKAKLDAFNSVTSKLETDYAEPPADDSPDKCCMDGCKFRVLLCYSAPREFHVCTNPNSPRAGMLTREDQAGSGCFEVA
ncbi:MAG: ParB/RepB/Spo0J family partition protein [Rhodospirillales bacterium]|nr:ParB/RepB/Spo0J family partition protein [Rhodospirillales bacterium]